MFCHVHHLPVESPRVLRVWTRTLLSPLPPPPGVSRRESRGSQGRSRCDRRLLVKGTTRRPTAEATPSRNIVVVYLKGFLVSVHQSTPAGDVRRGSSSVFTQWPSVPLLLVLVVTLAGVSGLARTPDEVSVAFVTSVAVSVGRPGHDMSVGPVRPTG